MGRLLRGIGWLLLGLAGLAAIAALVARKYGMTPGPEGSDETWFFHLGARTAS